MIPYIDNISPEINSEGETTFKTEGETGLYKLKLDKDNRMFELLSPDGWTESNLVDVFAQHKKRYNALEQGLAGWMFMCISRAQEMNREVLFGFVTTEIKLEGRSYIVKYCAHTNDIVLTIPGFLYVGTQSELTSQESQIAYLETGLVIQKIGDVVYENLIQARQPNLATQQINLPIMWNNIHEYDIGEGTYQIGYDTNSDLVMVLTKARTIKTELRYLDVKLPELGQLHSGSLKQAIISFTSELE